MTKRLMPLAGDKSPNELRNPLGRVGRMPELANLACYLLAPGSEFLNGQIVALDGGDLLATGANFNHLRAWGDEQWAEARAAIARTDATDRAQRAGAP
jgi:hypothetical protein